MWLAPCGNGGAGARAPDHRLMLQILDALLQAGLANAAPLNVPEPATLEHQPDANPLYRTHRHTGHSERVGLRPMSVRLKHSQLSPSS